MSEEASPKRVRLEQYLEDYPFTDTSHLRRDGDRIWVPELYCHKGCSLMSAEVEFDGLRSIHLRAFAFARQGDIYLSPIVNDPRKKGVEYRAGTRLQLQCPVCHEDLPALVPCTCTPPEESTPRYRRALYLTPVTAEMAAVGICEVYGCPQSIVGDDGELVFEVVADGRPSSTR